MRNFQVYKTRVSSMVCQGRHFHRSALLPKTAADSNDSNEWAHFGGVFFLVLTGGRNMVGFCGSSGPVNAYGLPYPVFWLIDVFFNSAGRLK